MHDGAPLATPVDFDPFAEDGTADVLPLTEPQKEMWAAVQMGSDASCAYNRCLALTLRGNLSVESMQRALGALIERHDALRVSFDVNGAHQTIRPTAQIGLRAVDLGVHPEEVRRERIAQILQAEATEPLNLVEGPPLRATLIRESADLHRLLVTVHHITCDGYSTAALLGDLGRFYAADRYGLEPQLPPAASYRDYVINETTRAQDGGATEDENYWTEQYADSVPVLDLPSDRAPPGVKTYNGASRTVRIGASLYRALKAVSAKHGCTLFVTLLAAFEALIARLSRQDDFVVGIPMAGQTLLDNRHLVGHCVHMIPLRCRVDHGSPFAAHLKQARRIFLEAQSHQQVTFGSLLRRLNVPRDPARTPLVSVTFNMDKVGTAYDFGDLTLEPMENPYRSFVNFELSVNIDDNGRELLVECHHNSDLFDAETIARWLGHYAVLLEAITADAGQRIDELPLLTEAEERQICDVWNDTAFEYPRDTLLHELVESQAARAPDAVAVVFEEQQLTYRELDARTNQLARHLVALGVGPDCLVPLFAERSLEMVIGILGILKAGGAYVPLDPDYPAERIAHVLGEVGSPVILTQGRLRGLLPEGSSRVVDLDTGWDEIARAPTSRVSTRATASNIAYVIYTSGSSGRPKGVLIPHAGICNLMLSLQRRYQLTENDVLLQKTPFGFDASVWEFFAPLIAGGKLVMARPGGHLDPAYLTEAILGHGVSTLQLVPSQLRMLLDEPAFRRCAPLLKRVYSGGEPLTPELCAAFFEQLPQVSLHNLYGPTETSIDATTWDCPREGPKTVIPIGRPVDNTCLYIVNSRNRLSPIGVPGELLIGGAGVARGYLHREELTAEKFVRDPFRPEEDCRVYRSGDLARYMADGNIEYLGRIDEQLKVRGYRIEPGEIESAILRHPAVRHAVVVAHENASGDKQLCAYFVASADGTGLVNELRGLVRSTMPEYMVPTHLVQLESLPLTHNGKLDRRALPVPGRAEAGARQPGVAPRTPAEELVADMFREVLAHDDIGIFDNFFDLGGDSIMAARLMVRLRTASGVDMPLRNLFERPTVARLAEAIDALSWLGKATNARTDAGMEREEIEL